MNQSTLPPTTIRSSPRRNEARPSGLEMRGIYSLVPALVISAWQMASSVAASPPECAGPCPAADEVYYQVETATVGDLLANDIHSAGLPLRVVESSVQLVSGSPGTLEVVWNGMVRYSPPAGFTGVAEATYRVIDLAGTTAGPVQVSFLPTHLTVYPEPGTGAAGAAELVATATGTSTIGLDLVFDGPAAIQHEVLMECRSHWGPSLHPGSCLPRPLPKATLWRCRT